MSKKASCFVCGNQTASSYFRFPSKEDKRRIWLQRCNLDVRTETPTSAKLCCNHFTEADICDTGVRRRLKPTALPISFLDLCESNKISPESSPKLVNDINSESVARCKYCFICGRVQDNVNRSYFRFPKNEEIRREWFDIIGEEHKGNVSMKSDLRLCSMHFSTADIIEHPITKTRKLKRGALPLNRGTCIVETFISDCHLEAAFNDTTVLDGSNSANNPATCDASDFVDIEMNVSDDFCSSDILMVIPSPVSGCGTCDKECQVSPDDFYLLSENASINEPSTPPSALCVLCCQALTTATVEGTSSGDNLNVQESERKRPMLEEPRYVGDVWTPHLSTPREVKRCCSMNKQIIDSQRKKLEKMARDLRDAQEKLTNMSKLVAHLENKRASKEENTIHRNPDYPVSVIDSFSVYDQKTNLGKMKRISSPEKWELKQMVAANCIDKSELPNFHDETRILPKEESDEEVVEIEIVEEVPPFFHGHGQNVHDLHPVCIVKNTNGSLVQAATMQSALAKEHRKQEMLQREQAARATFDKNWVDPLPDVENRTSIGSLHGIGVRSQQLFKMKRASGGKKSSFGVKTVNMSLLKQRQSLPIYKLKDELIKVINDNQILIVIGGTGSGKTTQITQYLAEAGFTSRGKIGCTQPRRAAVLSVAERAYYSFKIRSAKYFFEAPMFKIPGQTFPVEVLYTKEPETYLDASLITVMEIHLRYSPGDILLFLTGQEKRNNLNICLR